jgi:hypothetical protein
MHAARRARRHIPTKHKQRHASQAADAVGGWCGPQWAQSESVNACKLQMHAAQRGQEAPHMRQLGLPMSGAQQPNAPATRSVHIHKGKAGGDRTCVCWQSTSGAPQPTAHAPFHMHAKAAGGGRRMGGIARVTTGHRCLVQEAACAPLALSAYTRWQQRSQLQVGCLRQPNIVIPLQHDDLMY